MTPSVFNSLSGRSFGQLDSGESPSRTNECMCGIKGTSLRIAGHTSAKTMRIWVFSARMRKPTWIWMTRMPALHCVAGGRNCAKAKRKDTNTGDFVIRMRLRHPIIACASRDCPRSSPNKREHICGDERFTTKLTHMCRGQRHLKLQVCVHLNFVLRITFPHL